MLLQRAREERKRLDFEARRLRIEPNYEHSEGLIQRAEDLLRGHIRLPQVENMRPLPLGEGGPGLLPSNFLQSIVLNQYHTLHAPLRSAPAQRVWTLPQSPEIHSARISPYDFTPSTASEMSTPMTRIESDASTIRTSMTPSTMITTPLAAAPGAPSIKARDSDSVPPWLGEPSLPTHRATFAPNGSNKRIKLDTYRWVPIPNASRGRCLEWRGENPAHYLRHVIPTHPHETFPYTKHSTFKELRRVTFRARQMCTVNENEKRIMHNNYEVEYRFTQDDFLKTFQSDARDKDLIGTFEADTIKTRHGRHQNEQIKIWKSRELDQTASLTFFPNGEEQLRHIECALKWFVVPYKKDEHKRTGVLELLKPPPDPSPAETKKKGLFRRKSSTAQSPNEAGLPQYFDPASPTQLSKRGSVTTMDSTTSSIADSELPAHCPQDVYDNIRSLTVLFSSDKDFRDFNETFKSAQMPSAPSPRPPTAMTMLGGSRAHSFSSSSFDPIAELGDPTLIGSAASTTSEPYAQPHGRAQELEASTPASRLFGTSAGRVQHPTGYCELYANQPRPTPPSPLTSSPLSQRMQAQAQVQATGFSLGAGYNVPDPAPGSAELAAEREPAELQEQTRTERYEMEAKAGPVMERLELPERRGTARQKPPAAGAPALRAGSVEMEGNNAPLNGHAEKQEKPVYRSHRSAG